MAFYYEEARPTIDKNSSHDPATTFSGFYYQQLSNWVSLIGTSYGEMGNRIQDQSSSPYISWIPKGPNTTLNTSNPTGVGHYLTSYSYAYNWFDYQQVDGDRNGTYSDSASNLFGSTLYTSNSSYWGTNKVSACWYSDTPGSRYFCMGMRLNNPVSFGWVEINAFNPAFDPQTRNTRWVYFEGSSAYNQFNVIDISERTADDAIDEFLTTKTDYWEVYSTIDPDYLLKNVPVRAASSRAIGHLGEAMLFQQNSTSATNSIIQFDNKYYAFTGSRWWVRVG